ncbi:MAG: uncharacterized membrane protein YkvA (DUF1232 family) [Saprospiraceae bacterium]|jgi:uncharacterized membrane protein YkvA (DUF1232 family)
MKCQKNRYHTDPIKKLIHFLKSRLNTVGVKITYSAMLLFYAYNRTETPRWAKNIILGSLAYLLSPVDAIPDLTPLLGFTDDIGVLSFGLVTIACYIDEEVRSAAKGRVLSMYKNVDEEDLLEVDAQL